MSPRSPVFSRWISVLLASWALGGCLSGQTGSPDCVGATSCICDPLYAGGVLLRVHAESAERGNLVAVIDGIVSPAERAYDLQLGDRLAGAVLAVTPCASSGADALETLVGTELVVLYSPGVEGNYPGCSDFQACAAADCEGLSEPSLPQCWEQCQQQTREVCAEHREAALRDGVFFWAVPSADELSFGGSVTLSTSELGLLNDVNSCLERFPAEPAPPCEDTRTSCAVTAAPPDDRSSGAAMLFGLAALAYGSRRLRRR
jgi:MYXO-CTERM domain-containing protein